MKKRDRKLKSTQPFPITPVETGKQVSGFLRDLVASRTPDAINGFALVNAVFAFSESMLLSDLRADGMISAPASSERHGYHPRHTLGLLRFLVAQDFLKEEEGEIFYLTPIGEAVLSQPSLGQIQMYRGGYGQLMYEAGRLLDRSVSYGDEIVRNGRYVSLGSSKITNALADIVPIKILESIGVTTVADLGCGSAGFLIDWVQQSPHHRGVGIDIAPAAIKDGSAACEALGVADRVSLLEADGFNLAGIANKCSSVDAFYSFAMEHECLRDGEDAVIAHIDGMAKLFPGKRYLLGEPLPVANALVSSAFNWIHSLSHQGFPRDIPGWGQLLGRLRLSKLEEVFVPDHQRMSAYYMLKFLPK